MGLNIDEQGFLFIKLNSTRGACVFLSLVHQREVKSLLVAFIMSGPLSVPIFQNLRPFSKKLKLIQKSLCFLVLKLFVGGGEEGDREAENQKEEEEVAPLNSFSKSQNNQELIIKA